MAGRMTERITRNPEVCGGKACITGHRVRVMDIAIWYEQMGMSPDEIVSQIPTMVLSDVHAALAYYYDHIDEIRDDIRRNDQIAVQFRKQYPSKVRERLLGGAD